MARLPLEIIRDQREGRALSDADIAAVVQGVTLGDWSDAQVGAWAMAVLWRGLGPDATVALTRAMTESGQVLRWTDVQEPVLDKHSTGGVGDKVSLILAPLWAACGVAVPMISGRGLGHTGGTLDKLEAIPGFQVNLDPAGMRSALRQAGCCIVSAGADLAPADRRLYAIRDVTATVESVPLITASILSKKLAAGLQGLVMDVKCGTGAFAATPEQAHILAASLVRVAAACGLPVRAWVTDMHQVLGHAAGNALEVAECWQVLSGQPLSAATERLRELTLCLAADGLCMAGVEPTTDAAMRRVHQALQSGAAAEHWERMVRAQGGTVLWRQGLNPSQGPDLPHAPVVVPVPAPHAGRVQHTDVRALGMAVVRLGGGRARPSDQVDPRVGLAQVLPAGNEVQKHQPVAWVHAADAATAECAVAEVLAALTVLEPGQPLTVPPLIHTPPTYFVP